jgi:hypothetical protein
MSAFGGIADITATERDFNLRLPQKLQQLGDVHRDPFRLVPREQFRRRSPARLILEIDIGQRLSRTTRHTSSSATVQGSGKRRAGQLSGNLPRPHLTAQKPMKSGFPKRAFMVWRVNQQPRLPF